MNGRSVGGRCCCVFTCLASSAGLALLFLGIFLVLLGLLQSSEHQALRVSGYILSGSGVGLIVLGGLGFLCPAGRGELHECCLQATRASQVGAASNDDCESVSSGDSYYDPPPQLRIIPPTPFAIADAITGPSCPQGELHPVTASHIVMPR